MTASKLDAVRRTVEHGRSCWHADLGCLEANLDQYPNVIDAGDLSYELVKLLRKSSLEEGNYELEADRIQGQFEWSSRAKLFEQHKTATQLRKKVYKWRNGLQDLHRHVVEEPRVNTKVDPMDLAARAWSVYLAVCLEVHRRPFYNGIQLFLLTFVSYMFFGTAWVVLFIGLGYAVSCCEHAYNIYIGDNATYRNEVIKLLQDSMSEVPNMYKRAQSIENKLSVRLDHCQIFPPEFFDFIITACSILREPSVIRRKERLDEMVPKWIELLSNPQTPAQGGSDGDEVRYVLMKMMMLDIADLMWSDWPEADTSRRAGIRQRI
ncbi:hypothetical protein B0T21DRAFT_281953 [Apiosordaria backusii]|uniref:Uncharacterized protein n=1 Tax=Apiosordaria backusii TaxID=314023 RepID=A0AA40ETG4_9PEZI|nr:hypothetical protein B0T21DRAFT_281953 [Apiosordaria backusii]